MNLRVRDMNSDWLWSRDLEFVLWTPERLGRPSAWWGHVPFAFWIVANCEPRLLVELGTHYGVSYAAFCEAVARLGLPTRCYAVDDWRGDPHAGAYGEDVYAELKDFHDTHYASFSQLVRRLFNEARDDFADGSIDLLHIDGFHTYRAVRHDFLTWRPKLSSRAVVLFHDTNERQRDFGVWRFLDELKQEAPAFEFLHCHGLGVVAVGTDAPEAVKRLCQLRDGAEIAAVRERFSLVGARWMAEQDKASLAAQSRALEAHVRALEEDIAQKDARARALEEAIAQEDARVRALEEAIAQEDARVRALEEAIAQEDARVRALEEAIAQNDARARALEEAIAQNDARARGLEDEIQQKGSQVIDLQTVLAKAQERNRELHNQVQRLEQDLLQTRQENSSLVVNIHRTVDDHIRQLAGLKRTDYEGRLPNKLTGLRRLLPWRRKKLRRLANDYRIIAASPLFDADWYLAANPDVAAKKMDPTLHYLRQGAQQGLAPGPHFDAAAYLKANPDVRAAGIDPMVHYVRFGSKEGRDPSPFFSETGYRGGNQDVRARGLTAIDHYKQFGRAEGRLSVSLTSVRSAPQEIASSAPEGIHTSDPFEDVARDVFANQQSELSAELAKQMQKAFSRQPLISVIMPVYKTPLQWLRRAVELLQEQYYGRWELCAVDDRSPTEEQRDLLRELAASDARVRFKILERNGGISKASNAALEMAQGEYVALLDHDDELTPDALLRVVEAINLQPDLDFVYSDECKVDDTPARRLFHFIFKPDWSPELMFNSMMTGHLTVYHKAVVDDLGGFRSAFDFSQDYDLALRVAEVAMRIVHIERVLYLWRSIPGSAASGDKGFARASNVAALNDALLRRGIPGAALSLPHANCVRVALPADAVKASIIIPSDSVQNLRSVLESIREHTVYPNYEVVVVCNGPLAERLKDDFCDWEPLRFVHYDKKYNFSDKCNEGARAAAGEIVIFYNDDVYPLQPDWITRLIEYLWVPGVGGVSPKLLHANDTIQYAGMISGTPGLCGTAYNNVSRDGMDSFLTMHRHVRNVSILSGACCALWKDVFWKVGAFDVIHTPDGHSDMDLSYKLMESGYRCVYTPHAILRHVGNHSWGVKRQKYKADIYVLKRWGRRVSTDPYFTASMKRVLYHDFQFVYRIYGQHIDPEAHYSGPDVLFVAHELTLTGAPRMLFYAAKAVRQSGGFPVIVAPADGPLRAEMLQAGLIVIVDELIRHNHFLFERFARNFDLAVVNTNDLVGVVRQLSTIPILRTIWWLHEAKPLYFQLRESQGIQWERICPLCVSDYAKTFVPEGIAVRVIYNGIPDEVTDALSGKAEGPLTFILSGTIEPRKGQDIFVEAIALLPPAVRRDCRFLLTGKLWDMHRNFWRAIEAQIAELPQIEYLGSLDHKSQLRAMADADVIVCCSRDDACSLVVVEAAMLSKPAILSDHVGVGEVFDDESCLRFQSESITSLAGKLLEAFERRDDLKRIGMAARRTFEQNLTLEAFGRRFMALVSEQIASGTVPVQDRTRTRAASVMTDG